MTDVKYQQLYREYANAIRRYDNAIKDRRRVRARVEAKRRAAPLPRRPVGSPRGFRIPQAPPRPAQRPPKQRERRIYLGKILGWAKIVHTAPPVSDSPDPDALFDSDRLYDSTSLKLYQNAKLHYESCKKAFFDYVRRQNIDVHHQRAEAAVGHAANAQLLGDDSAAEKAIEEAQGEVEQACRNAWAVYQRSPSPKSDSVKVLLLEHLGEAQLMGLDDRDICKSMQMEAQRLLKAGVLRIGKH
jgi:hypothetical protein